MKKQANARVLNIKVSQTIRSNFYFNTSSTESMTTSCPVWFQFSKIFTLRMCRRLKIENVEIEDLLFSENFSVLKFVR